MGDGNEPTGAEHGSAKRRRPDEGMFCPGTVISVYYEVERYEEAIHVNVRNTETGEKVGYLALDVTAAERVAREMLAEVAKIERILEAQAGAS